MSKKKCKRKITEKLLMYSKDVLREGREENLRELCNGIKMEIRAGIA